MKRLTTILGLVMVLLSFAETTPAAEPIQWSICLHAGSTIEEARVAFKKIKDLGGTLVRTDFDWRRLESSRGKWDPSAIEFFDQYVNEASKAGIEVVVILFQIPDWALELYQEGKMEEFIDAWSKYAEKVAQLYGDRVKYYQYWNEPNAYGDILKPSDHWRVFLAADQAVRRANQLPPVGIVNYTVDNFFRFTWRDQLRKTFEKMNHEDPQHGIRMLGIDLYPSTWTLPAALGGWNAIDDLNAILTDPEHPCFGFDAAVTETGYSQFLGQRWNRVIGRSEDAQMAWFKAALPFLQKKLQEFNSQHEFGYRWIGIYELHDGLEDSWHPDSHFGLYRNDGGPKKVVEFLRSYLTVRSSVGNSGS